MWLMFIFPKAKDTTARPVYYTNANLKSQWTMAKSAMQGYS